MVLNPRCLGLSLLNKRIQVLFKGIRTLSETQTHSHKGEGVNFFSIFGLKGPDWVGHICRFFGKLFKIFIMDTLIAS